MIANVTNIEGLVRGFAIQILQSNFPNLDLTENSAFDDLFIKPMIKILLPIFEKFNSFEMMQNLDNAEYMTEEELDRIGEGNYFTTRRGGKKATTILTLSFANIAEGENIVIPVGIMFETGEGLQYQTVQRFSFSYDELISLYNSSTTNYDVPITVEAVGIGTAYNVEANTITTPSILFNTNLVSVTNQSAVTNGKDKATNLEYAEAIKNFYISRQLGTDPGYKAFILENFEEVEDVYVSGYKDPFMMRDIIKVYDSVSGTYKDKHIGGMVDLYIKGYTYDTEKTEVTLLTNMFLLSKNYSSITATSVSALNQTDLTKTPVILSKNPYVLNGVEKMAIILDNTGEQSFSTAADNQIYIAYDYVDESGVIHNQVDHFTVGNSTALLSTPVKEILSIVDSSGTSIADFATHYELTKEGEAGTTQETCTIKLIGFNDKPNGTVLTVNYVINYTLNSIGLAYNKEEYRLTTADVLAREALPAYINIGLRVKMKIGFGLDTIKTAKIKSSLINFFDTKGFGSSIEESDIVNWITTDDELKDYIDYIVLPFDAFYITANAADALQNIRTATNLSVTKISYPVLNKISISEI